MKKTVLEKENDSGNLGNDFGRYSGFLLGIFVLMNFLASQHIIWPEG